MIGFLLFIAVLFGVLAFRHVTGLINEFNARLLLREREHARLAQQVGELEEELRKRQAQAVWAPRERPVEAAPVVAPPAPVVVRPAVGPPTPVGPPVVAPVPAPVPASPPTPVGPPVVAPVLPTPRPAPVRPAEVSEPMLASTSSPSTSSSPPTPPVPPPLPAAPAPAPPTPAAPAEPTWWDNAEQILLDNWTGILGAVVLVTGVGFLGVYTALQVTPPVRFGMISAFAGLLLGGHLYLRTKAFAAQLHVWLQSSAAAIFLFACVGAVSVPGLQWVAPPMSYALLLLGVGANLWLAWHTSRQAVATLHGVLSLVALTVIPPTLLTLGAAAAVTAFSIGITWRQQWKYQLLLSIASFFAFHQYWHYHLAAPADGGQRVGAMALVLLVGVAAAVVQYRRVYAAGGFDALLFTAHVLNWTCLGINLYQYSTGSVWKTIPLGLGALLTFGVARVARRMGIRWLYRTDSILSLLLALFTAFSLQGWHATGSLVLVFMLAETLLIGFVMIRESEQVVFRVATAGALLAGGALVALNLVQLPLYSAVELHRNAALLLLAGALGAAFYRLVQPQLVGETDELIISRQLQQGFGGVVGALYLGVAALLTQALFGAAGGAPLGLLATTLGAAGAVFGLAWWLRAERGWFRNLHLLSGQALLMVTTLGLHELGLSWPTTVTLLYFESMLMMLVLARSADWGPHRVVQFGSLVLAGALPILVYQTDPDALTDLRRALLLLLAALGTTGALAGLEYLKAPAFDAVPLHHQPPYRLRLFGLATGVLLLAAFGLVEELPGAVWAAEGIGTAALLLRRAWPVAGVWEGLLVAVTGACALEWNYVLSAHGAALGSWGVVGQLAPLVAPIAAGWVASWWAEGGRHLRAPWLYLLGTHLALGTWAAVARHGRAWPVLVWLVLAMGFAVAAQISRRRWPDEAALAPAGRPDRYLRHWTMMLIGLALAVHLTALVPGTALLLGWPARRLTAVALLGVLVGLAGQKPPLTAPIYRSWRLQELFPELALLFAAFTISCEVRVAWETLAWIGLAFGLSGVGRYLPLRLRRIQVYSLGFFWLTVLWSCYVALRYLAPGQLLKEPWITTAIAVALLFGYTAVGLARARQAPLEAEWPPLLAPLARLLTLTPRQLVVALLYPAFVALTVLLVRSFDRSVLTVLLMLEVVAVFASSLVLRRPDLRYAALLGVAVCLVRLVFFDLSQRGTITRAIVFILMGLLLLGMNALYARFKDRFSVGEEEPE